MSLDTATAAVRYLAHHPHSTAEDLSTAFPTLDAQQVAELVELYAIPVIDPTRPETIRDAIHTMNTLYMV